MTCSSAAQYAFTLAQPWKCWSPAETLYGRNVKDGVGLHAAGLLCPHYQESKWLWQLLWKVLLWSIEPVWRSWNSRIVQNERRSHPAGTSGRLKQTLRSIWKDFSSDLTQVCERWRSSSCMCALNAKTIRNQSSENTALYLWPQHFHIHHFL